MKRRTTIKDLPTTRSPKKKARTRLTDDELRRIAGGQLDVSFGTDGTPGTGTCTNSGLDDDRDDSDPPCT